MVPQAPGAAPGELPPRLAGPVGDRPTDVLEEVGNNLDSWQDSTHTVGDVLGRRAEADRLVADALLEGADLG